MPCRIDIALARAEPEETGALNSLKNLAAIDFNLNIKKYISIYLLFVCL